MKDLALSIKRLFREEEENETGWESREAVSGCWQIVNEILYAGLYPDDVLSPIQGTGEVMPQGG